MSIGRPTPRAGVFAERRYRQGLESWRRKWRDGAEGERKTEKALRPLEKAGWTVVHDVEARYGNYDHIAVGPAGVYLFETKNLQGIVDIRSGAPHLTRRHDPDACVVFQKYRPRALGAAADIKQCIQERSGHSTWGSAGVADAVAEGKSVIQREPTLSASLKAKVEGICNKAASGNLNGARAAAKEVCVEIINASPIPSAAKAQALAACKAS